MGKIKAAEELALQFHQTYERLAPSFGYETRPDTKVFDSESNNGKLMIAVCSEMLSALSTQSPKWVKCPACGGDGKETCNNPDHGFIGAMPGEIGRLGCPGCGHDPNHKVPNGGDCEGCNGAGKILEQDFDRVAEWCGYDSEAEYLDESPSSTHPLQEKIDGLREALEEIVEPIKKMSSRLKDDEKLNGIYAVQLSNDANYLKSIAQKALETYK